MEWKYNFMDYIPPVILYPALVIIVIVTIIIKAFIPVGVRNALIKRINP